MLRGKMFFIFIMKKLQNCVTINSVNRPIDYALVLPLYARHIFREQNGCQSCFLISDPV